MLCTICLLLWFLSHWILLQRIRFSSMWKSTVSSTNFSMTVHGIGIESTFSSVAIGTLLFSILNPVNIVSMKINRRSSEKWPIVLCYVVLLKEFFVAEKLYRTTNDNLNILPTMWYKILICHAWSSFDGYTQLKWRALYESLSMNGGHLLLFELTDCTEALVLFYLSSIG